MSRSALSRPAADEHAPYYSRYIAQVPDGDVIDILESQLAEMLRLLSPLGEARALQRYAPGKWSVKEVVGHITDAERVFAYRALRIARGDQTPLASFDQGAYVSAGRFDARPFASLLDEFFDVRRATLSLLCGLDEEAATRRGVAAGNPVSVRAVAYTIAGHAAHHVAILRERYAVGG
jgi:hypothetical protein